MLLLLKLQQYFTLYCEPERQRFIQILLPTHLILDILECFVHLCFLGIWVDVHKFVSSRFFLNFMQNIYVSVFLPFSVICITYVV